MNIPIEIQNVIEECMEYPLFKQRWVEHRIYRLWDSWVGEKISEHVRPINLHGDILTVLIDDERWAYAFGELQDKILAKLNLNLGHQNIKGFAVQMDKKKRGRTGKNREEVAGADLSPSPPLPLTNTDITLDQKTEEGLTLIKDTRLREALRRVLVKAKGYGVIELKEG